MNRRRLVLIISAVVLALIGTGVVYSYISSADSRALNGVKARTVLIAAKDIPVGTPWSVAKANYVATQSYPESAVPPTALDSTAATVSADYVTTYPVQKGEILVSGAFGSSAVASTGSLRIKGGLQAITIALAPKQDVGGFVQPDSEVAVYATVSGVSPARLLIDRVHVLAVSQAPVTSLTGPGATAPSQESLMVTLEVNQTKASLLAAQAPLSLYLALLTPAASK